MLKVGIVTSYSSKRPAGLERFLIDMLRSFDNLKDDSIEFYVYARASSDLKEVLEREHIQSIKVIPVGFGQLWKEIGLFFTSKSDVYLFNGPIVPLFFRPRRYIVLIYDFAYRYFKGGGIREKIKNGYINTITRIGFRRAEKIITISDSAMQDAVRLFHIDGRKFKTIYPGFAPLNTLKGRPVENVQTPFFMFIGTLKERKNVHGVVHAFAKLLQKKDVDHSLVIVGKLDASSEYVKQTQSFIDKSGLRDRVIFTQHVSDDQVAYLYKHATALVFPSFLEGFGFPILEAMSCGTPVITSKQSSLQEVAGGAALLVDPHDEEDIAAAMERIINDDQYVRTLRSKGETRVKDFSWATAAEQFRSFFRNQ